MTQEFKKMKIGIDIDEVVVECVKHYLEIYRREYGKHKQFEDITTYNLWEPLEISREEAIALFDNMFNKEMLHKVDFIDGAKEFINKLAEKFDLFFITARPLTIKKETKDFLETHFPYILFEIRHSRRFSDEKSIAKEEICRNLGVSILVEDDLNHAEGCANVGIKVLLLDKPWNQDFEHENVLRVYNWKEIYERIKEFKEEEQKC